MRASRGTAVGLLVFILLSGVLYLGMPGRSAVTITIPYSSTPVSDGDLDGDPSTGDWTGAGSWSVPLETGAADPYGTATLYAKHDGAYVYLRLDGAVDVLWVSVTGDHFWLGMQISAAAGSHHGGGSWDGVYFGEDAYTSGPPLVAVDTNGFDKLPAKDTRQDTFGEMRATGSAPPYAFTAEWKRPLDSGDSQDIAFVADGATAYYFYVTLDSNGGGSSGGGIGHRGAMNNNVLYLAPAAPPVVHDVAVTAASASPTTVVQGEPVVVEATVANQGDASETFDVTAYAGALTVATEAGVPLGPGATTTLRWTWDTTAASPGDYLISVVASTVAGETDTADNTFLDGTVTILAAPVHDVTILAASASPLVAEVGAPVTITATAANVGSSVETFDVTAYAGSVVVGTQTVSNLGPGASVDLVFLWDTSGAAPGDYPIRVEASVVPGETNTGNNAYADGTVTLTPPPTPYLKLGRIWPEWRRAPSGTPQTFYGKVVNLGSLGAYAQVVYEIRDRETGALVAVVSSGVVWVPSGATVDGTEFASEPWWGPVGVYTVLATLYYGTDPANLNIIDGTKAVSRFAIV